MAETIEVYRPVASVFRISSPFLPSRTIDGMTRAHHGIDFAVPEGTPVKCMWPGEIFITGWESLPDHKVGLGYRIWQKMDYKGRQMYAWYAHLSKIMVDPSDRVETGQILGLSGNTGHTTGPHLHVQFREKDTGDWLNATFLTIPGGL